MYWKKNPEILIKQNFQNELKLLKTEKLSSNNPQTP